ncbi:hypothetical protein [Natronococcus sp. A-GB7]|uniref:hypothetical protein n=1 Tax=Natronococcus sp. A-GB7 TaxID=3037649 RepID=UPI00241C0585|nr:hypothetical protein [Natronococcus sp. A-GB7]MDG5818847.1 hypothetical protein [Natronococcus sp. A-GB7]
MDDDRPFVRDIDSRPIRPNGLGIGPRVFDPQMDCAKADRKHDRWSDHLDRTRNWVREVTEDARRTPRSR